MLPRAKLSTPSKTADISRDAEFKLKVLDVKLTPKTAFQDEPISTLLYTVIFGKIPASTSQKTLRKKYVYDIGKS